MTDIFIDTPTIGAWAQQTSYSDSTLPGSSDLGLEEPSRPIHTSIYLYIAGKLDSTGPRKSPCLIPSTVSLVTAVLCGCHGDVCISRHWSLSPRYGGAMGGMSWSLVMVAAPASDSVPSLVLISPHYATR